MGEWRYSAMHFNIRNKWRWLVRFTQSCLNPEETVHPGTYWTGVWVIPTAGLDIWEREKFFPYRESNSDNSSSYSPVAIPPLTVQIRPATAIPPLTVQIRPAYSPVAIPPLTVQIRPATVQSLYHFLQYKYAISHYPISLIKPQFF
jgi:hypothetical protein